MDDAAIVGNISNRSQGPFGAGPSVADDPMSEGGANEKGLIDGEAKKKEPGPKAYGETQIDIIAAGYHAGQKLDIIAKSHAEANTRPPLPNGAVDLGVDDHNDSLWGVSCCCC